MRPVLQRSRIIEARRDLVTMPRSAKARLRFSRRRMRKVVMRHAENILYRMCGLPIVVQSLRGDRLRDPDRREIKRAYAKSFWSPDTADQWLDILISMALFPIAILSATFWYSWKNAKIVAQRSGRPVIAQVRDQIYLAATKGLLPPWYYIFELFLSEKRAAANDFLTRAETKQCIFPILSSPAGATSPLGDKADFASFCEQHQLPTVPVILVARRGGIEWKHVEEIPPCDLFLKPVDGRGGRGAERWDFTGDKFRNVAGVEIGPRDLLERITAQSNGVDLILQPRIVNHAALEGFSNGVLTTVRVLSCLDEQGDPEIIDAVFRMAIGSNRTVDNFHAGGILASIDLDTGRLGRASNLGTDARLGWLDAHPDTGRQITGEVLPMWKEVRDLTICGHRAFSDRAIIGWDVGIAPEGAILVEGNYGPDVDMMQRPGDPLGRGRFTKLIAHHLRAVGDTTRLGD